MRCGEHYHALFREGKEQCVVFLMHIIIPKVFALLSCIKHFLSRHRLLKLGGCCSNLAVDIGIILYFDSCQRLANETFFKIMNYARDCVRRSAHVKAPRLSRKVIVPSPISGILRLE